MRAALRSTHSAESMTTCRWIRSLCLEKAIPDLRKRFELQANEESSLFPIFSPDHLKRAWDMYPEAQSRQAAVLVPICSVDNTPSVMFTVRSSKVTTHKSEISFPGGHLEDQDQNDLVRTALREAHEELLPGTADDDDNNETSAFPWKDVEVIGSCTAIPSINGTPVTPVIAVLPYELSNDGTSSPTFSGHADEVDTVFYQSIDVLQREESLHKIGRLESPAPFYPSRHGKIWGLTAFILRPILRDLLFPVLGTRDTK